MWGGGPRAASRRRVGPRRTAAKEEASLPPSFPPSRSSVSRVASFLLTRNGLIERGFLCRRRRRFSSPERPTDARLAPALPPSLPVSLPAFPSRRHYYHRRAPPQRRLAHTRSLALRSDSNGGRQEHRASPLAQPDPRGIVSRQDGREGMERSATALWR